MGLLENVPSDPAVYALIGGRGKSRNIAYVGIADDLKRRLGQHIEKRNSSITTGASIVSIDPEKITQIIWWVHPSFADRGQLEAAEEIAFEVLEPTVRSRGNVTERARKIVLDEKFSNEMRSFFKNRPSGQIEMLTYEELIEKVNCIEENMESIRKELERLKNFQIQK